MSSNQKAFCWLFLMLAYQFHALMYESAVTGVPSWNFQPALSLTVHVFESVVLTDSAFV